MTERQITALQRALVRLLWNSVADQNGCSCYPRDRCPECHAMLALGLGRWRGWKSAQRKLARFALERGWRSL
jgi:hypothetical protein